MQVFAKVLIIASNAVLTQMLEVKAAVARSLLFTPLTQSDLAKVEHLLLTPPLQLQATDIDQLALRLQHCPLKTLTVSGLTLNKEMLRSLEKLLTLNPDVTQLYIEDCELSDGVSAVAKNITINQVAASAARLFRAAMTTFENSDPAEDWFFTVNDAALGQLELARSQKHPQATVWGDRARRMLGIVAFDKGQLARALQYFNPGHYQNLMIRSDVVVKYAYVQNLMQQEAAEAAAMVAARAAMGA